jgi:hypothetical protein
MLRYISAQPRWNYRTALLVLGVFFAASFQAAFGQTTGNSLFGNQAVGGVSIDAEGILNNSQTADLGTLSKMRREALEQVPGDMHAAAPLRKVSLRRLEEAIDGYLKDQKPLPDSIRYLAGLQRIQYVFVYPEKQDIILVGPGEGWKVDPKGNIVGVFSGRPVMLLDDLLVALRATKTAKQDTILCSIEPTSEGRERMNREKRGLIRSGDPKTVAAGMEKALGMQQIILQGVPGTSHFARVMVAADYRMKRIGMNFDPSPVPGLPSYLQMITSNSNVDTSPRFWLKPIYEALFRDADGLAFEFRGSGVKAMTETDYLNSDGSVRHSGKTNPLAQKWADLMTEKYPQLAVADPVFGQLQNCMELAVVGALIAKEDLPKKAGHSFPTLFDSPELKPDIFNEPKQTPTISSILDKGRKPIISASGGVSINAWAIAGKTQASDAVQPVREKSLPGDNSAWWWN